MNTILTLSDQPVNIRDKCSTWRRLNNSNLTWIISSKRDGWWLSYIAVHWNVPISRPLQRWSEWNVFFRLKSVGGMVAQTNRSRLNRKQHRSVDAIIPTERASFHPKEMVETTNCWDSLLCTDMYQSSNSCKGDGNGRVFSESRV
jgi:hypothetical protein